MVGSPRHGRYVPVQITPLKSKTKSRKNAKSSRYPCVISDVMSDKNRSLLRFAVLINPTPQFFRRRKCTRFPCVASFEVRSPTDCGATAPVLNLFIVALFRPGFGIEGYPTLRYATLVILPHPMCRTCHESGLFLSHSSAMSSGSHSKHITLPCSVFLAQCPHKWYPIRHPTQHAVHSAPTG